MSGIYFGLTDEEKRVIDDEFMKFDRQVVNPKDITSGLRMVMENSNDDLFHGCIIHSLPGFNGIQYLCIQRPINKKDG